MGMGSRYRRILKIGLCGAALLLIVFVVGAIALFIQLAMRNLNHTCWGCGDRIAAPPESCQQAVSDQVRVRLRWTPYISSRWSPAVQNRGMDPYVWGYFKAPWIYYDITHDGGHTWIRFWTYDNETSFASEAPHCDYFGKLNDQIFWLWRQNALASTRDGGQTWRIYNLPNPNWSIPTTSVRLSFTDAQNGRLERGSWGNYVTVDGGITWTRVDQHAD